jgi:two-component system, NarL family, invasion response regulator UvrY
LETSSAKRVLIINPHPIYRKGLKKVLSTTNNGTIYFEENDGNLTSNEIRKNHYQTIILDLFYLGEKGFNLIKTIKTIDPSLPILASGLFAEEEFILQILKAKADGYVDNLTSPQILSEALLKVMQGKKFFNYSFIDKNLNKSPKTLQNPQHGSLSQRELQIFTLIAKGNKTSQIAHQLGLSWSTVSTHKANILRKMKMKNSVDLIKYYLQHWIG